MRSQSARSIKLNPVDEENRPRAVDEFESRRVDPNVEERMLRNHIRAERSAAFWLAATTFGMTGLVSGACAGVYLTNAIQESAIPMVRDTLVQGQAMHDAAESVNSRPSLVDDVINPRSE